MSEEAQTKQESLIELNALRKMKSRDGGKSSESDYKKGGGACREWGGDGEGRGKVQLAELQNSVALWARLWWLDMSALRLLRLVLSWVSMTTSTSSIIFPLCIPSLCLSFPFAFYHPSSSSPSHTDLYKCPLCGHKHRNTARLRALKVSLNTWYHASWLFSPSRSKCLLAARQRLPSACKIKKRIHAGFRKQTRERNLLSMLGASLQRLHTPATSFTLHALIWVSTSNVQKRDTGIKAKKYCQSVVKAAASRFVQWNRSNVSLKCVFG